jgi:hypothetical protein
MTNSTSELCPLFCLLFATWAVPASGPA